MKKRFLSMVTGGLAFIMMFSFASCEKSSERDSSERNSYGDFYDWEDDDSLITTEEKADSGVPNQNVTYSEGLEYAVSEDRTYVIVKSQGDCKDTTIVVPPTYQGLPVKAIGVAAFGGDPYYDIPTIRAIILPDSVTEIQEGAFAYATRLNKVVFGKSIQTIGYDAFVGCYNIQEIYVDSLETWCNINFSSTFSNPFYTTQNTRLRKMYIDNIPAQEELIIPEGITELKSYVFCGCDFITKVKIGDSVTKIAESAFEHCSNLTDVEISASVSYIGYSAFVDCSMLLRVDFKDVDNWKFTPEYEHYGPTATMLDGNLLKTPTTAAMYLTTTYVSGDWVKQN